MTKEALINYIIGTIIILLIIGIIKIIRWILKQIVKLFTFPNKHPHKISNPSIFSNNPGKNSKRDLDRILLHIKVCIREPKRNYQPSNRLLQNFLDNPYNAEYLNDLIQDILKFIDYRGNMPTIQYGILNSKLSNHEFSRNQCTITINSQPHQSPNILIALIIRECIHLYMYYKKFDYVPKHLPEENVDVYAVYLGFYNFMINGYEKIGYLDLKDFQYIRGIINTYKYE